MTGPWERYQKPQSGPWQRYQPAMNMNAGPMKPVVDDIGIENVDYMPPNPTNPPQVAQKSIVEAQAPGFLDRVRSDYDKRIGKGQESANAYLAGKQSMAETMAQQGLNMGVAFGSDIIGQGVKSAGSGINTITGGYAGKAGNYVLDSVANSPVGRGAGYLSGKATDLYNQQSPRTQRNLDSFGNLLGAATAVTPIKGVSSVGAANEVVGLAGKGVAKVGQAIEKSGQKSLINRKAEFVQDLITPKETPTVKADLFSRSKEKGIFRNRVFEPSPLEKASIDAVSELPVSKSNSMLKNYNIISDANTKEAQNLANNLKKNDIAIKDDDLLDEFITVEKELKESPFITGDGETAANKVLNGAFEALKNNPPTASGVLQARKDFDNWVRSLKGDKAFNPALDSPATIAIQKTRQAMNNVLDRSIPDANLKQSLAKQSAFYRAMDSIQSKGGLEGKDVFERAGQKIAGAVPGKTVLGKAATIGTGLGVAGASSLTSLPVLSTAGAVYGATKVAKSPYTRMAIGKTVKAAGQVPASISGALKKEVKIRVRPSDKK